MAEIRRIRIKKSQEEPTEVKRLVIPGDIITSDSDYMRGHGTYLDDNKLLATVAGVVETVNKLIHVNPMKTR
ncbi:Exosome complex component RRP4 [Holothuria leucospilota]|nr:Exosome complex component RRP4 [Holothuria leucospilota]